MLFPPLRLKPTVCAQVFRRELMGFFAGNMALGRMDDFCDIIVPAINSTFISIVQTWKIGP